MKPAPSPYLIHWLPLYFHYVRVLPISEAINKPIPNPETYFPSSPCKSVRIYDPDQTYQCRYLYPQQNLHSIIVVFHPYIDLFCFGRIFTIALVKKLINTCESLFLSPETYTLFACMSAINSNDGLDGFVFSKIICYHILYIKKLPVSAG